MARQQQIRSSGYTILVIDDQEGTLESTRALLERDGHVVLTAASGEAGIAVLQRQPVALVITDYRMPGMDGPAVVRAIRRFDAYVQIILQTGEAGDAPPLTLLQELDIQGYHAKGDGPVGLLLWVAAALKAHRLVTRLLAADVKAEFVTQVSHHFRTPLAVINTTSEALARYGDRMAPEQQRIRLERISRTVQEMTTLLDDVLVATTSDEWARAPVPEPTDVRKLCETLVADLRDTAGPAHAFEVTSDASLDGIDVDRNLLTQVLRPVLVNAVKFSPGGGTVSVRIGRDDGRLDIRVEDQGIGIPLADQARIFDEFQRAGNVGSIPGTGLGLSIARRALRALGGALECISAPGQGTSFAVSLPIRSKPH